jgi:HEAT repeat protein
MRLTLTIVASLFAIPVLAAPELQEEAEELISQLGNATTAEEKVQAIERLGEIGQIKKSYAEPALPTIVKALEDEEPTVRAAAALAYGQLDPDPEEAIEALTALLKDEDLTVRAGAARGLGVMGPKVKDALPALREALERDREERRVARAYREAIKLIAGR